MFEFQLARFANSTNLNFSHNYHVFEELVCVFVKVEASSIECESGASNLRIRAAMSQSSTSASKIISVTD